MFEQRKKNIFAYEENMKIKKIVNRSALACAIVCVIVFVLTGGDPGSIGNTVGIAASMATAGLILIREIMS
ncbi:hypothetical protein B4O97_03410 [Marispirochaeta aestuarii]|uniref:Uncharacterized protein n=2 Tax=Marispirochaeta aestuarii TaxID=1963862 RepID=A0A1Y1S177_9SPIO|nr:hypothetical protein B4O97_03410 [Marispirochaeta aestuarii]